VSSTIFTLPLNALAGEEDSDQLRYNKRLPVFSRFQGSADCLSGPRVRAAIFQIAESNASRQPALQMLFSGKLPDFHRQTGIGAEELLLL
jgi:hypothetical protein